MPCPKVSKNSTSHKIKHKIAIAIDTSYLIG